MVSHSCDYYTYILYATDEDGDSDDEDRYYRFRKLYSLLISPELFNISIYILVYNLVN